MDCPDGSLCRITCSAKETLNQTVIVKICNEDLTDFNHLPYKLVTVGADISNCEPSASDKSDEEDEESKKFESFIKSLEEDKKTDSDKITETNNSTNKEPSTDNYHKKQHKKAASKGSNYSRLNCRRRIYNTSQERRNYNGTSSGNNYQNSSSNILGTPDIEPWLSPMPMGNLQGGFQFSSFPHYANRLDSHIAADTNCEANPAPSLLRTPPYTPMSHQFRTTNQSSAFVPGQNYWNSEYHSSDYQRPCPPGNSNTFQRSGNSKNYQRSGPPDRSVSRRQDVRDNFRNKRKVWRNKTGKTFDGWNRNRNEKERGSSTSGYYKYDYRN